MARQHTAARSPQNKALCSALISSCCPLRRAHEAILFAATACGLVEGVGPTRDGAKRALDTSVRLQCLP